MRARSFNSAGMWVLAALPKNSFVFVMYVEVMQGWKGNADFVLMDQSVDRSVGQSVRQWELKAQLL